MFKLCGAARRPLERRVRPSREVRTNRLACFYLHHRDSQGIPSLFPSIFVPGQFFKKNVASAQEVI